MHGDTIGGRAWIRCEPRSATSSGSRVPIFSVGFGEGAGPELVAAVSGAEACGVLGLSGMPSAEIERRIEQARARTDRPFGGNVIIAALDHPDATDEDHTRTRRQIGAATTARVPLLVLFWGDAAPFVEDAHANGVRVALEVGSVDQAQHAADAASSTVRGSTMRGVDVVIYEPGMLIPAFDGDPEHPPLSAGLSVDAVNDVKPAAEIVRDLVRETEEALAAATR